MDTDTLDILTRTLVSLGLLLLVFQGKLEGSYGGTFITIIMGIDLAAILTAVQESQTQSGHTSGD